MTCVRVQALPLALSGSDVVVTAETGSGKTLCYVLPYLAKRERHRLKLTKAGTGAGAATTATAGTQPRMLVLAPNHELCNQVSDVLLSIDDTLNVMVVSGRRKPQVARMRAADVVVATPAAARRVVGRVPVKRKQAKGNGAGTGVDTQGSDAGAATHEEMPSFDVVVLDEADLLLGSFRADVDAVLQETSPGRHGAGYGPRHGRNRGGGDAGGQQGTTKRDKTPQHIFCAVRCCAFAARGVSVPRGGGCLTRVLVGLPWHRRPCWRKLAGDGSTSTFGTRSMSKRSTYTRPTRGSRCTT